MDKKWTLKRGSKEHGPMSERQLRKLAEDGKLRPTDQVRKGTEGPWRLVSSVEELVADHTLHHPRPANPSPGGHPSSGRKSKLLRRFLAAAVCFLAILFALGFAIAVIQGRSINAATKQANHLWEQGQKKEAVDIYRELAIKKTAFIKEDFRAELFDRVISFDAENGNQDSVETVLERAKLYDIPVDPSSEIARSLVVELRQSVPRTNSVPSSTNNQERLAFDTLDGEWKGNDGRVHRLVIDERTETSCRYFDEGLVADASGRHPTITFSARNGFKLGDCEISSHLFTVDATFRIKNSEKLILSGVSRTTGEALDNNFYDEWERPQERIVDNVARQNEIDSDVRVKLATHAIEAIMDGGRAYRELEPRFNRVTPENFEALMRQANSKTGLNLSRTKLSSMLERTEEFETQTGGQAPAKVIRYGPNVKVGYGYSLKRGVYILYYAVIGNLEYTPDGIRPH